MGSFAERAVEAEAQLKSARQRIEDLENRLQGWLEGTEEPPRNEQAEQLLVELGGWINENPSVRDLLPPGFYERLTAQLWIPRMGAAEPRVKEPTLIETEVLKSLQGR